QDRPGDLSGGLQPPSAHAARRQGGAGGPLAAAPRRRRGPAGRGRRRLEPPEPAAGQGLTVAYPIWGGVKPRTSSSIAWARDSRRESPFSGPISCAPTGRPEAASPAGTAVAGRCRAVASEIQLSIDG